MAEDPDMLMLLSFARQGDVKAIGNVLDRCPAAHQWKDKNGFNALLSAAAQGQTEAVELLLDRGANIESRNGSGLTALVVAACNDHPETARLLVLRGANIETKDDNGRHIWACIDENGQNLDIKAGVFTWTMERISRDATNERLQLIAESREIITGGTSSDVKAMRTLRLKSPAP